MKKKIILIPLILILAVTTFWGIKKYRAKAADAPAESVWVNAEKAKVVSVPLEVHAIGSLTGRSIEITSEIPGHIAKIYFKDGAAVKAGETLIGLDDSVYQAKSTSAQAQLNFSESNYKRMLLLGKKGAISKQAIDQAYADLKEKEATAQEMRVMLQKSQLTAPFAGIVAKRKVHLGEYINSAQALVTLTDIHHLHVDYNIPEKFLPALKLGQTVSIKSNTYPDKVFQGKVAYIAPMINPDNRSVSVYAEVDNKENLLASGMFVNVTQGLGEENKVTIIPARALVPVLDGEQVYKIVDNKAFAATVISGKRIANNIQILQGISSGDVIITDGQLKVRNGTAVKVKETLEEKKRA